MPMEGDYAVMTGTASRDWDMGVINDATGEWSDANNTEATKKDYSSAGWSPKRGWDYAKLFDVWKYSNNRWSPVEEPKARGSLQSGKNATKYELYNKDTGVAAGSIIHAGTEQDLPQLTKTAGEFEKQEGAYTMTSQEFTGMNEDQRIDAIIKMKYGKKEDGSYYTSDDLGKIPGEEDVSFSALQNQLRDFYQKVEEVDPREMGFLAQEYGGATGIQDDPGTPEIDESQVSFAESLAGQQAGAARKQDMYTLQKGAGKIGAAMGMGGGMASGMRAGIAGQQAVQRGFETAQDTYGLTQQESEFARDKSIYGLEQEKSRKWDTDFADFLAGIDDI
jgi:hypothetical protein